MASTLFMEMLCWFNHFGFDVICEMFSQQILTLYRLQCISEPKRIKLKFALKWSTGSAIVICI